MAIPESAPGKRLQALLHAFPRLGNEPYPGIDFLAMLHEPTLDLAGPDQPPLSAADRTVLVELLRDSVLDRMDRMCDVTHHDIASWIEDYWLPVTPRRELEIVSTWGPVSDEELPDRQELPVTAVAHFHVHLLFSRGAKFDENVDHECHVEMRRLATKALRTNHAVSAELDGPWELRTHGPGWHHGGQ